MQNPDCTADGSGFCKMLLQAASAGSLHAQALSATGVPNEKTINRIMTAFGIHSRPPATQYRNCGRTTNRHVQHTCQEHIVQEWTPAARQQVAVLLSTVAAAEG
jgi:hypothetical protein